jgi:hypothetical protein
MTEQETPRVAPQGVTEYFQAIEAANATFKAAMESVDAKYAANSETYEQRQTWREERRPIDAAHTAAHEAAWSALKGSSDPLVKWIAENCEEYRGEAGTILKALPATADELDDLAEENEWCTTWNAFRDRAIAAGVLPGARPMSVARKALFDQIDDEACCRLGSSAKRRVSKALDVLIEEALKAAREPEAAVA